MKIIITIIPTDLVQVRFYPLFVLSYKPKTRIRFSASWWSGNEKYFCFLFTASRALLQSHAELKRLLQRNFLTCYSCLYYSYTVEAIIRHQKLHVACRESPTVEKKKQVNVCESSLLNFIPYLFL